MQRIRNQTQGVKSAGLVNPRQEASTMTALDDSGFGLPIPEGAPQTCLICGFYATEDVEAQQKKHFEETGHGTFDYV